VPQQARCLRRSRPDSEDTAWGVSRPGACLMIVGIHQPNYVPWLGYFAKMAQADIFVFLDNVQFSKGSYTNRVQILAHGRPRWLTVPVKLDLGDPITKVVPAQPDWVSRHLDILQANYRTARCFHGAWDTVAAIYAQAPTANLAALNEHCIVELAARLGTTCRFRRASEVDVAGEVSDRRLASIVANLAPGGTYLFGAGGATYQRERSFAEHGLSTRQYKFTHPTYDQVGAAAFIAGASVLDAVFNVGWEATAALIRASASAAAQTAVDG